MLKKRKVIPSRYIYVDPGYKTKFLQHSRTGKMMGRQGKEKRKLPLNVVARIDTSPAATKVRRIKSYGDYGGEIWGRTGPVLVRGSSGRRGTTKIVRRL